MAEDNAVVKKKNERFDVWVWSGFSCVSSGENLKVQNSTDRILLSVQKRGEQMCIRLHFSKRTRERMER